MRIGLNTSDWGKKAGTFFKKAKGEIKDTANLVRDKTEAFVESFKEEVNAGTSDGVTLSSAIDHGESVSYQPETFIEEVGPEENKGLSKKEKGCTYWWWCWLSFNWRPSWNRRRSLVWEGSC